MVNYHIEGFYEFKGERRDLQGPVEIDDKGIVKGELSSPKTPLHKIEGRFDDLEGTLMFFQYNSSKELEDTSHVLFYRLKKDSVTFSGEYKGSMFKIPVIPAILHAKDDLSQVIPLIDKKIPQEGIPTELTLKRED